MRARTIPLLSSLLALILFPAVATAQPMADKIPDDALLYIGWTGANSMGPAYAQSHLKAVMDASNMPELFSDFLPRLLEMGGKKLNGPNAAKNRENIKLFSTIVPALLKHPSALYFGGLDLGNNGIPKFAILCDAGPDAQKLVESFRGLIEKAQNAEALSASAHGTVVVLEVGVSGVGKVLDGKEKSTLAINTRFKEAMGKVNKDPAFAVYGDIDTTVKQIDAIVGVGDDARARERWPKIRAALGIGGINRVAYSAGFDAKDWMSQALIEAPAPRTGLIGSWFDCKPINDEILASVPKSATIAMFKLRDFGQLVDSLRSAAASVDDTAAKQFDAVLAQASKAIGVDIRGDFLGGFGPDWAIYASPEVGGSSLLGVTVVNRMAKPDKAQVALSKLMTLGNEAFAKKAENGMKASFRERKLGDFKLQYLNTPAVAPGWIIDGKNWYFSFYPQSTVAAAELNGKSSILENEQFTSMRKRLGNQKACSVGFVDLAKTAPEVYPQVTFVTRFLQGAIDMAGEQSPPLAFPPLNRLMPHLTPAGSVAWSDETGWHMKSITPFPGARSTCSTFNVQSRALILAIMKQNSDKKKAQQGK